MILGVGMETSGISIPIGDYALPGMATSTLVGILMNLILPMPANPGEGKGVAAGCADAEVEAKADGKGASQAR